MCFKFLWDGKQNKISKNVVCQLQEDGRTKDGEYILFLSCMKISWLRRISSGESNLKDTVMNFFPDFCKLTRFLGNMQMYLCKKNHNPFWKDVLKHYKNIYTRCEPKKQDEFMSECLFFNIKIIRDKRVVNVN